MGMLEGKVVVVTGAGRGIGRGIALLAAQHGARVVVNDLGGGTDGSGQDLSVAQQVVNEIKEAGGVAVANGESVADFQAANRIIQTAVDTFGRIDVVVNNAGILRDRIIFNMSEEEWDAVIAVHLKGCFNLTRHATPLMKQQKSGAIINFTSASGLVGNYGQANYAAAKLGIVGLTKATALDMARYGVTANAITPFAWSRLIGTIPTDTPAAKDRVEKLKRMDPNLIAPLAVYLGSDEAREVTGQIFGMRANELMLFSHARPLRQVHRAGGWTPEEIGQVVMGAFKPALAPLDRSPDVWSYDPLV